MASTAQTKKIHTLLNVLGLEDDTYRELLSTYGVSTSKAMTSKEAGNLISRLEAHALCTGRWSTRSSKHAKNYESLGIRKGMATPKQLRMIEGMWFDVTRQGTRADGLKALKTFLNNKFNIADMSFISQELASKIVKTLKQMKTQQVKGTPNKQSGAEPQACTVISFADYKRV